MRELGQLTAVLCVLGTLAGAQVPDERAAKVLADARAALGGEQKLMAVRSFTTTGRTRRVQGDNLVPIEFEILVQLPDKYLRKDEIPAQESDPSTTGFNGDALVQIPAPAAPEPRPGSPPPPAGQFENMLKQRVLAAKQDFARLMLGFFASSFDAYPLTFKYVGQAEAPQGKAHVLEATGDNTFKLRYFVEIATNLPIMVSWTGPARPTPPAQAQAAPAPEQRLYFADYREVDGIKLPFRLRRGLGTNTTEETTFDRFRINPKIDPRRFEVRK